MVHMYIKCSAGASLHQVYLCVWFRNSEVLVPHIFQFLVMLSYEKYHSKPIIDMPRIIHRCDGIMASGLRPDTHGTFEYSVVY